VPHRSRPSPDQSTRVQHNNTSLLMSAVALQWALNETTGSVFSVAKGLIRAASSDNIQALALLVCEAFGNTLAMCSETCLKVEQVAGMHHQSIVVKFLKAQVGYSSGDSGTQLSSSAAGVRFLALAAALNTLGAFNGAVVLEALIAHSARNRDLLPTVTQIKHLLNALDYKLNRAGFAENLAGWSIWFIKNPLLSESQKEAFRTLTAPSAAETVELVKVIGELGRLGDAVQITVTVSVTAPWVSAFIKWSLGMPPSIFLHHGPCLLEQPFSSISLALDLERQKGMSITISRQINQPAEIIESPFAHDRWQGMVPVQTYAEHKLQLLNLSSDLARRTILQALPYAVKRASHVLQPEGIAINLKPEQMPEWKNILTQWYPYNPSLRENWPKELIHLAGSLFPEEAVLASALSEYIGSKITSLPELPAGTRVSDLPLVGLYQKELTSKCQCSACDPILGRPHAECLKNRLLSNISSLVADILAISLIDCIQPVLLYIRGPYRGTLHQFELAVRTALTEGGPYVRCAPESCIDWVLGIVGHDISPFGKHNWIISSYRGQTFYPRVFETNFIERDGLLVMAGAPGALRYDGQIYNKGVSRESELVSVHGSPPEMMSKLSGEIVEIPCDPFRDLSIKWEVSKGDNLLYISLVSSYSRGSFNPFPILFGAIHSLYVQECPHPRNSAILESGEFVNYTSPFSPWGETGKEQLKVGVIPAHGNDAVRMLCLVHGVSGVVQQNSCLQCCLDVCRKAGYQFVIDARQNELGR
jgi:hypothetical protein